MTTSRIPATIDYLVDTFTAAATLGAASPPVAVYDGPVTTQEHAQLSLWVGVDDVDSDSALIAATGEQTWAGLGKQARDELFSVNCVAEAWSGDTGVRAVRTAVYGIVAAVEDIVRTDANLGGTILVTLHGVTGHTLRQNQTSTGAVAQVSFTIACKARIGG
ncbi:hypothetical protein [Frankia sp. Cj3]|uniref:hypothetical protein n=1 Tax=Frankia sp. Cj3 TaxID=2880976 RepID=UPI001EF61F95|nr:hypothetical protein [Frankia sp. Cj3]